ncbi:MAG: putative bifunctional diguanylate cyclase/phosphodiesterase [Janthinobacterium lividum]
MDYPLPRMRLLHWLVGSRGVDDESKQSWLIATMFTRIGSLVGAAASELIVATIAVCLHPTIGIIIWLCSIVLILLWRIGIFIVTRTRRAQSRPALTGMFAASSVVWAVNLGIGGMLCNLSGNLVLQMLSNACTCSILAGLSVRNAGTPRLATTQLMTAMSLISLGAALSPQLWIKVLIAQAPFFVIGLSQLCFKTAQDQVSMLDAQQHNAALARHDSLTGLPNRVLMTEALHGLLASSGANGRFALIWVDLDGFKAVNDTLGHAAGDLVLVETAQRLAALCASSRRVIARLGGDEFLILVAPAECQEAKDFADSVTAAVRVPHALPNAPDVRLDASIGIALYPEHGMDANALLAAADKALYAVKTSGKARAQVYDPLLHAGDADLVLFRSDLARALSKEEQPHGAGELILHYQPVTRLSDGLLAGREALVRWRHPVRGMVSPGAFVPMAEASGLILPLGEWVLRHACADAALWADGAKVAVNVSPIQLRTDDFAAVVIRALRDAGLPAEQLEVEVTETVLLSRDGNTLRNMESLRDLGIKVVLDDFGTGFSSLSNLCCFVFDRIKIDGSFVREALTRRDCAAVVRATVELARHLGVPTTAECIETQAQLDFVRACGCDEAQGFLLGRPMPASNVSSFVPHIDRSPASMAVDSLTRSKLLTASIA